MVEPITTRQCSFFSRKRRFLAFSTQVIYKCTMKKKRVIVTTIASDSLAKLKDAVIQAEKLPEKEFLRLSRESSLIDPTILTAKGSLRHRGITLLFSDEEHVMLHIVSEARRDRSYSHTLRTLIFEEAARIWPQGITASVWEEARNAKAGEGEKRKKEAEEYALRLRKKAEEAREKQLLAEEVLRRLGSAKKLSTLELAYEHAIRDRERKLRRKLSEREMEEVRMCVRVKRGISET